ncbi:DUF4079 domain-containing protein [Chloropicon primus]|uniref:Cytochrome b561 domain-containing protein n=1 Tax=Chloropicon primus TaxID=1764295 RepID=A0A5B8MNM7_9CHLO|nr:hypothetical protein A3770_05p36730 [Chloropicon primus]UPR00369.1 DUF4079 domain-containing protein [Chloropicon primus]|eukprot:QDZ21155.1 hypothetical protein A3770_05p36730 [Chloropicon primus]
MKTSASTGEGPSSDASDTAKTAAAIVGGSLLASAGLVGSHVLVEPLTAYFNAIGVPVIEFLHPPEWVLHWFHAINMGIVLAAMGGYGAYLGYQIRGGKGSTEAFGGELVRELHPKLMLGMTFFFFLGGQGGLVFTIMEHRPLLESPHAISALSGLGLLGLQGVIGATMKGKPGARTLHTYLGSSIMALLVAHAGLGIANGLSF